MQTDRIATKYQDEYSVAEALRVPLGTARVADFDPRATPEYPGEGKADANTDVAPWYVIPSDRKWYRNWAVTRLLLEHLRGLDPQWPAADFDVEAEKARLSVS